MSNPDDVTGQILAEMERDGRASVSTGRAIIAIRSALKRRSGKLWSVRPGAGTAAGWITIDARPSRRTFQQFEVPGETDDNGRPRYEWRDTGKPGGRMSPADAAELRELLGGRERMSCEGVSVPDSNDHRIEFIARAEGREPPRRGERYWD